MSEQTVATLSDDVAAEQVSRLALLRGFPADNAIAMKSLIEWLQKLCVGGRRFKGRALTPDDECRVMIDETINRCDSWRSPSQLRDVHSDLFPNYPQYDSKGRVDE